MDSRITETAKTLSKKRIKTGFEPVMSKSLVRSAAFLLNIVRGVIVVAAMRPLRIVKMDIGGHAVPEILFQTIIAPI